MKMTYKIETTDPITQVNLDNLADKPYVVESDDEDNLVIYFENESNKNQFLENSEAYSLSHYDKQIGFPHPE